MRGIKICIRHTQGDLFKYKSKVFDSFVRQPNPIAVAVFKFVALFCRLRKLMCKPFKRGNSALHLSDNWRWALDRLVGYQINRRTHVASKAISECLKFPSIVLEFKVSFWKRLFLRSPRCPKFLSPNMFVLYFQNMRWSLQIEFSPGAMGPSCTNFFSPNPLFSWIQRRCWDSYWTRCGHMLQHYAHLYIGVQYCPNI